MFQSWPPSPDPAEEDDEAVAPLGSDPPASPPPDVFAGSGRSVVVPSDPLPVRLSGGSGVWLGSGVSVGSGVRFGSRFSAPVEPPVGIVSVGWGLWVVTDS